MNFSDFIRDRLFYQSDVFLRDTKERVQFERLTMLLISEIDLVDLNRDKIMLQAYCVLQRVGADERTTSLVFSLLDGGIEILRKLIQVRDEVIAEIGHEITELHEQGADAEIIDDISTNLYVLKTGSVDEVRTIVKDYKSPESLKRQAVPFESAFLRYELREHAHGRTGKNWGNFRARLARMFGLSDRQIAAMKAWESATLRERGGKTVEELIQEIRQKTERQLTVPLSDSELKQPKISVTSHVSPEVVDTSKVYEIFIPAVHLRHVKALEPSSFLLVNDKITPAQRRWIFALMILSAEEQKSSLRKILAGEIFNCSVPKICAVTAYLTGGCRQRASAEIREDFEVTESYLRGVAEAPVLSKPSSATLPESVTNCVCEGGEHFDYDNEAKRAWRNKLQEFVDTYTNEKDRAKMRVICLPGVRCLEIPVYTQLGFDPQNIVGVEGGDALARAEFAKNATRFGIQAKIGRLEEILPSERQPFDVISYDFLGQMCVSYAEILGMTRIAPRATVCVNVMAKRESDYLGSLYQYISSSQMLRSYSGSRMDRVTLYEQFEGAIRDSFDKPDKIGEIRDEAIKTIILRSLNMDRDTTIDFYKKIVMDTSVIKLGEEAMYSSLKIVIDYLLDICKEIFKLSPDQISTFSEKIYQLIMRAFWQNPRLTGYEKYSYKSDRSPFQSFLVQAETCGPTLQTSIHVIKYVFLTLFHIQACREAIKSKFDNDALVDKEFERLFPKEVNRHSTVKMHPRLSKRTIGFKIGEHSAEINLDYLKSAVEAIDTFDSGDLQLHSDADYLTNDLTVNPSSLSTGAIPHKLLAHLFK